MSGSGGKASRGGRSPPYKMAYLFLDGHLVLQRDICTADRLLEVGQCFEAATPVALVGRLVMSDSIAQDSEDRLDIHASSG